MADTENLRQRSQKLVEEAKLYGNFRHYLMLILEKYRAGKVGGAPGECGTAGCAGLRRWGGRWVCSLPRRGVCKELKWQL